MSATFDGQFNLYDVMGLDESVGHDQIRKQYRDLARRYHPDKNPNASEEDVERMSMIVSAYKVLSNERLRYLYDTYKFSSQENQRRGVNRKNVVYELFVLGLSFASFPFRNLEILCKGRPKAVGDGVFRVFRERGLKSLYRGTIFTAVTDTIHNIFESNCVGPFLAPIALSRVLAYPTTLISNLIVMNPQLTLGALIPALLKTEKQEFQFKNLWYGYSLYAGCVAVEFGYNYAATLLKNKSFEKYIQNPESKFWRYLSYATSSRLLITGLGTLLFCPFDVLLYQSQYRLLGAIQNGALVSSIEPISIKNLILSIYKTQGIMKFFSGYVPAFIYQCIADITSDDDSDDYNNDDSDDVYEQSS